MNKTVSAEEIGSFIRELRKKKGFTQKELGDKIKVSDKAVSKWERGLSFPDITLLPGLAEVLDVTISEIMNGMSNEHQTLPINDVEAVVNKTMEYSKKSYRVRDKKLLFYITLAIAAVTCLTCLIINIAVSQDVTWALYPAGAVILTLFPLATALFCTKNRLEITAAIFFISLMLYLVLVGQLSGTSEWVYPMELPITAIGTMTVYGIFKCFSRIKNRWYAYSASCVLLAVPAFFVNLIIEWNGIPASMDSTNIGAPVFLLTAAVLFFIGRSKK